MSWLEGQPSGLRILVADDNVDAADCLVLLLRLDGHDVAVEYDGVAALSKFNSMEPHVVFLDLGMPGMTGYELARRIRSGSRGADVLLVAISGWGTARDRAATAAAGFNHHLVKPADFDVLREWIRTEAI
jgi:two-component system, sensor histidine kinase